ncbi:MAG TPA: CHAT domain-containing protein [Blastocatellia bacterium]
MSISMYRNNVVRYQKEISDLRKQVAQEQEKMARIGKDLANLIQSLSGNISLSTLSSKQSQLSSKQNEQARIQKKISELEARISSKMDELNRNLDNLNKQEAQEQKKQDDDAKKRQDLERRRREEQKKLDDESLRRSRDLTREMEKQSRLFSSMRSNRLVIDLSKLPTKIKVVFFASNPKDQSQLRLDEEIRLIEQKLRASDYRDSVQLVSRWAVRPDDLLQSLNEHKPHIVHFSGHGTDDGDIVFLDPEGNAKIVTIDAMVMLMRTMADNISVIIFNACFSERQAEAVTEHIDLAIGMNDSIGDEAARVFSAQFYSAIGFGRSVQEAFMQAKAALMLEGIPEENTPVLFTRVGIDPNDVILVRP